ncbi:hypothetical protein BLNAU_2700 [Blattamonas nauphoetae]|uniref:Bromo domain-containing protein n=1 Tax=Blattamonas nauphoetae TaxID=2049346 RepID=A0ABQ9YFA6_9EUKA|nr:hypothetical protein BLNAU_2700 [Blattamonas nauphoetae]
MTQAATVDLFAVLYDIVSKAMRKKEAAHFLEPVNPVLQNIPDYPDLIKYTSDLGTVSKKLQSRKYAQIDDALIELFLVFDNCFHYNFPNHDVSKAGRKLQLSLQAQIDAIPQLLPYQKRILEKANPKRWWKSDSERYSEDDLRTVDPYYLPPIAAFNPDDFLDPDELYGTPLSAQEKKTLTSNLQSLPIHHLTAICEFVMVVTPHVAQVTNGNVLEFNIDSMDPKVQRRLLTYSTVCMETIRAGT